MNEVLTQVSSSILFLVKIGVILFLFIYVIFAGVVIKQVRIMTETVRVGFEPQIKLLVFAHFLASLVLFFLALIIL